MLEVRGVSLAAGVMPDGEPMMLLREISAHFPRGHLCAVVGPSGSGKSTLLKIIAGIREPEEGSVHWEGRDLAERDGITRRYIRYLPASGAAGPSIAVSDDDGLAFRTYNRRLITQVSDEPRLAPRAWRDIVRRCFDDGPRLTGRRAHQD